MLWQEPFVIYSRILAQHREADRRPDGDQPGHPHLGGHRLHLRHAQRHVRQPHGLRHRPRRLRDAGRRPHAQHAGPARARRWTSSATLAEGREADLDGTGDQVPVGAADARAAGLDGRVRPQGARRWPAEEADGFILQLADPYLTEWMVKAVRTAAAATPDATRTTSRSASPRPRTSATTSAHARDQCRWFGGMVGNHVADLVSPLRRALRRRTRGAHRLHQGPRGLRLLPPRPRRQPRHRLRARRDRRPVLPARPGRGAHREARRAARAGRRPVRRLRHARRPGDDHRRLRRRRSSRPSTPDDRAPTAGHVPSIAPPRRQVAGHERQDPPDVLCASPNAPPARPFPTHLIDWPAHDRHRSHGHTAVRPTHPPRRPGGARPRRARSQRRRFANEDLLPGSDRRSAPGPRTTSRPCGSGMAHNIPSWTARLGSGRRSAWTGSRPCSPSRWPT